MNTAPSDRPPTDHSASPPPRPFPRTASSPRASVTTMKAPKRPLATAASLMAPAPLVVSAPGQPYGDGREQRRGQQPHEEERQPEQHGFDPVHERQRADVEDEGHEEPEEMQPSGPWGRSLDHGRRA